ncbi:MAG TPA: DUF72 domain-containing protein [Chitinophagaceae bacterium]
MEFGRVAPEELDNIDFHLPPDGAITGLVLPGERVQTPKVYLGCAKWGRPEWVGRLYPPKTRPRDFLKHYVHVYNSIELNLTHYKIYGASATAKWAATAVDSDFLFCPKMFEGVTHHGKLRNNRFMLNEFLRGIRGFGDHLGPVLVQFSDKFSPKRFDELITFLSPVCSEFPVVLELRHRDWFRKAEISEQLTKELAVLGAGFVITDAAGRRDCLHMNLSTPEAFVRFVGNSLHPTDFTRIDEWVMRINSWLQRGLRRVFFFIHMHDEALSPELALYAAKQLNNVCGTTLPLPPLY